MAIQITLDANKFDFAFSQDGRDYTGLQVERSSNGRIYFCAIKDGVRWKTIAKQMKLEDGKVFVSFGKQGKLYIGTYVDTDQIVNEVIEEVVNVEEETTEEILTPAQQETLAKRLNKSNVKPLRLFKSNYNDSILLECINLNLPEDKRKPFYFIIQSTGNEFGKGYDYPLKEFTLIHVYDSEDTEEKEETINPVNVETVKESKQCEPMQKLNITASYAKINYKGDTACIVFTNDNVEHEVSYKYRRSWSHRKYIDIALSEYGVKPSWDFRYGWEYVS